MMRAALIVIPFIFLAIFSALGVALGLTQAAAIPVAIAIPLIIFAFINGNEKRSAWLLTVATFIYIGTSLLWPRYAAIFIPGLPLINIQRIGNAAAILTLLTALFASREFQKAFSKSLREHPLFWISIATYIGFRITSSFLSIEPISSFYRLTQEVFVHIVLLFCGLHIGNSEKRFKYLMAVIAASVFFCTALAIAEQILQKNVFSLFISPKNEYMAWALSEKVRDGAYRSKAIFDHPLTFAEFSAIAASLAIAIGFFASKRWQTLMVFLVIFASLASILLSGSRAGYMAAGVGFIIFSIMTPTIMLRRRGLTLAQATTWSFGAILVAAAASAVAIYTYTYTLGERAHTASDLASIEMLERSIDLLQESPIYGHGVGLAAELIAVRINPLGNYSVDSLLMSIAVESGVIALVSFLFLLTYCIYYRWKIALSDQSNHWIISHSLALAIFSVLLFKSILSLLDNNHMMYLLLGLAVSSLATNRLENDDASTK